MVNEYSLVQVSDNDAIFDVVVGQESIGQVGLVNDGWRYRLGPTLEWSVEEFGSELEASEIVLVERNLLEVGPNGVIVSDVTIRK